MMFHKLIRLQTRNPLVRQLPERGFLLIPLLLACFALLPRVQAVAPPPPGGYGTNTAAGTQALQSLTSGVWNTALGYQALFSDTTGNSNTATGLQTLFHNVTGVNNTATGVLALNDNTSGFNNVANGWGALSNSTTGSNNTAIGVNAASNLTTGSGNVYIGASQLAGAVNESNTTRIKNIATSPLNTGMFLEVDSTGKIGFIVSSRRYKHDIEPMGNASEALFALKPVTFRYNGDIDPAHVKMFGLVAEEVAKVNPDLAVRNAKGEIDAIRFDSINAMLLNEFLKEHQRVEELQATVAQQQKGMEILTAQLKEQAAQIQKVSAQLETGKPVPKVVVNRP